MDIRQERDRFFLETFGEEPVEVHKEVVLDDIAIGGITQCDGYDVLIGLYVAEDKRGQGYGQKLLEELESVCTQRIRLATYFDLQPAIRLYQKNGYYIDYYYGSFVIMEKVNNGSKQPGSE